MTKVPVCENCGRKNTFVESEQDKLCAVCEQEEPKKKSKKDQDE